MREKPDIREDALQPLIRFVAAVSALLWATTALAQSYPDRPVRIIVPFAPGGPTDVIARVVADKLSANFGKQLYVVNQPGASGNTGAGMAATSPPDGYTLIAVSTGFMINPSLFAKVPYDAVKDFAPITVVATSANVLSVHPPLPARTLKDLVDLIKAGPTKYDFASPGIGSTPHLAGELLRATQGLTWSQWCSPAPVPPSSRPSAGIRQSSSPPWPQQSRRSRRARCAASP